MRICDTLMNQSHIYFHVLNIILWQHYHDFVRLIHAMPDLAYLWNKAKPHEINRIGLPQSVLELFWEQKVKIHPEHEMEKIQKAGIELITIDQSNYPTLLTHIHAPPLILYLAGGTQSIWQFTNFNWDKSISIVGTRRPSPYGKIQTQEFTHALASENIIVVSGLAMGIDSIAHHTCTKVAKPTIAVLGSGLNNIYPWMNRKLAHSIIQTGGVMLSEFPPDTPPYAGNFPRRNRIVSGLSRGTLVIEGQTKSGSLITARFALEQGREVWAIPSDITRPQSQAGNFLISQSQAQAVTSPEEILDYYGIHRQDSGKNAISHDLSHEETRLLKVLEESPMNIDALAQKTFQPVHLIHSTLSLLELKNLISKDRDMFYIL